MGGAPAKSLASQFVQFALLSTASAEIEQKVAVISDTGVEAVAAALVFCHYLVPHVSHDPSLVPYHLTGMASLTAETTTGVFFFSNGVLTDICFLNRVLEAVDLKASIIPV